MSGYGDALSSTSRAGEGDAVIFKSSGPGLSNNIRHYFDVEGNRRQQQALQKQKFSQANQTSFYKNLQDIKAKIWDADLEEINTKINDDIIKYATEQQKNGIDVFSDPQSMVELNGKLGQLSALASASKSAQEIHNKTFQQGIADDWKNYDDAGSYKSLMEYKNLPIAQRALINPELKLRDFNADEYVSKNIFPDYQKIITPIRAKTFTDEASRDIAIQSQIGVADGFKERVKNQLILTNRMTPDEAEAYSTLWTEQRKAEVVAYYNPQPKQKEDNMNAYRTGMLDVAKGRLKVAQRNASTAERKASQSEVIPINIASVYDAVTTGDGNAIEAFNAAQKYANGDDADQIVEVVKGDGKVRKNEKSGGTVAADPNKVYIITQDKNGKKTWNATDDASKQSFIDSKWGVSLNKYSQIDQASNKPIKPFSYGTQNQSSVGKGGTTTTTNRQSTSSSSSSNTPAKTNIPTKNKTIYSKSKSGKDIYSDDGGKTWKYK
jgi:hypothetical protein